MTPTDVDAAVATLGAAVFETCDRAEFPDCDVHHVSPWEVGGVTDLANLAPLCTEHHHLVHEGGWTLVLHRDRRVELRWPDGAVHHDGPSHDVVSDQDVVTRHAALRAALDALFAPDRRRPP